MSKHLEQLEVFNSYKIFLDKVSKYANSGDAPEDEEKKEVQKESKSRGESTGSRGHGGRHRHRSREKKKDEEEDLLQIPKELLAIIESDEPIPPPAFKKPQDL